MLFDIVHAEDASAECEVLLREGEGAGEAFVRLGIAPEGDAADETLA